MMGQWTVTKPSRSDEVLDADQQLKISNQIRAQFDTLTPKRPTKPNRSEPDSETTTIQSTDVFTTEQIIPELDKLRSLQSQSPLQAIYSGDTVEDEFVETQYYKELVSIDKQHHTTGSGFISLTKEESEENGYTIQFGNGHGDRPAFQFRSNPATNDWIPNSEDDQAFVSSKPNRSENC